MDSMPPARATSQSPALIPCAAIITALSPDPQTLLRVVHGVESGRPAPSATCRAGAWPTLAGKTQPAYTSWTASGGTPAASRAARATRLPSWGAVSDFRAPR